MEKQDIINILKQYNFLENSIRKFSLEYKITEKTVKKYLVENNIPYSKRTIKYEIPRDVNGRYKLKVNKGQRSNNNQSNENNNQIKQSLPKHKKDSLGEAVKHVEDSKVNSNLRKGEPLSQAKGCQSFSIDNFMKIKKNTKPFKTILQEMQKL